MRRSRHLKPDTFPFLAVLLCTMGSLIVVLLVLDRQARKKARQQAEAKAAFARKSVDDTEERERLTALERHQREMSGLEDRRRQLQRQRTVAQNKLQTARGQLTAADEALRARQQRLRQLQHSKKRAQSSLSKVTSSLSKQQLRLTSRLSDVHENEQARLELAKDVAELGRQLERLRAKKKTDAETWSVLPYEGKQGENRRPLYVECTADGLVFYPDRKVLRGVDLGPLTIRREVLRRIGWMELDAGEGTYWLLLVRPDGIMRYYQFLASVRGLALVYGYELIDRDWQIDLPLATKAPDDKIPDGATGAMIGSPRRSELPLPPDPPGSFSATRALAPLIDPRDIPLGRAVTKSPRSAHLLPKAPTPENTVRPGVAKRGPPTSSDAKSKTGAANPGAGAAPRTGGDATSAKRKGSTANGSRERPLEPAPRAPRRDWELIVECTADGARILSADKLVAVDALQGTDGQQQLLTLSLQSIQRHRALLQENPDDFRPRLRFVVHVGGRRSYHLAYPALRALAIPTTTVFKDR